MNISWTIGSEAVGVPRSPADVVSQAIQAEADGFNSVWCTHFSQGIDALTTLAAAAAATERIELGVGVVPSYPRHPVALAQAAATVQSLAKGRFTLGVGVSHRPVIEGMHGLDASDPIGHMREYLTVLVTLLTTGTASFQGSHYRVETAIGVPGTSAVPVVVGALAPKMSRLGGELADGITTWLAGPRALEEVIVPAVTAGSADAGRATPRVLAAMPVAIDPEAGRARAAAGKVFARYGNLPNYQRLFVREGITGPAEVAIVGDEVKVAAGIQALFDAGATDVWAVPFDTGNGITATMQGLKTMAAG